MTAAINHKLIKADSNQCSFCSVKHYISPCRSHSLLSINWSHQNQTKNTNHVVTLQHGGPFKMSASHSPLQQLLHTNCCGCCHHSSLHLINQHTAMVQWVSMGLSVEFICLISCSMSALLLLGKLTVLGVFSMLLGSKHGKSRVHTTQLCNNWSDKWFWLHEREHQATSVE